MSFSNSVTVIFRAGSLSCVPWSLAILWIGEDIYSPASFEICAFARVNYTRFVLLVVPLLPSSRSCPHNSPCPRVIRLVPCVYVYINYYYAMCSAVSVILPSVQQYKSQCSFSYFMLNFIRPMYVPLAGSLHFTIELLTFQCLRHLATVNSINCRSHNNELNNAFNLRQDQSIGNLHVFGFVLLSRI